MSCFLFLTRIFGGRAFGRRLAEISCWMRRPFARQGDNCHWQLYVSGIAILNDESPAGLVCQMFNPDAFDGFMGRVGEDAAVAICFQLMFFTLPGMVEYQILLNLPETPTRFCNLLSLEN